MKRIEAYTSEPYRIFFPIGILFLIVGIIPWLLWPLGLISTYPRDIHRHTMVGGFLVQFAVGFLMTAIPKFTGTTSASSKEVIVAISLSVIGLLSSCLGELLWFEIASILLLLMLIIFGLKRVKLRKWNPPPTFLFLPVGLLGGTIGMILILLSENGSQLSKLGQLLFYEAMMLALIVGVGGRLIPALLGWSALPKIQIEATGSAERWSEARVWAALALLFAGSYFLQGLELRAWGQIIKFLVVCVVAFKHWRIQYLPRERGVLAAGIYGSAWLTVLGVGIPLFTQFSNSHWNHVLYMGGFAFLTLFIGSRVTLAHGGFDLSLEKRSLTLGSVSILLLVSLGLRLCAVIYPAWFSDALFSAAIVFLLSILIWASYFIPKMRLPLSRTLKSHEDC